MKFFSFRYELVGTGWARATLSEADVETVVTASYLSDALRDLLEAIALITEGVSEARCVWQEEPGEYRWLFSRRANDLHLEIRSFPDMFDSSRDEQGEVVFRTTRSVVEVARTVLRSIDLLADECSPDRYEERWVEHSFPAEALERLRRAYRACRTLEDRRND